MFSSTGYSPDGYMGPAFDAGPVEVTPSGPVYIDSIERMQAAAASGRTGFTILPSYWGHAARRAYWTARTRAQGLAGHQNRHNRYRLLANPEG